MITEERLRELIEKYGSPFYLFHEDEFKDNFFVLKKVFRTYYRNYYPAYSYKTNYTPEICRLVQAMGGYAEVVSDMEYKLARKIGYTNDKIIFNGPFKGDSLEEHFLNGGILNIDNRREARKILALAEKYPQKILNVGIRVNIDVGQSFISRFGIDADGGELEAVIGELKSGNNIRLEGLHCHIGQSRTLRQWQMRTERMLQLADRFFIDRPPRYIDLGSGMFAVMNPALAKQFGEELPSYEDYARVTVKQIAQHYKNIPEEQQPLLFTEPGTTVVSSYMDFVGEVAAVKTIKGKTFVVLNCSKDNIGDICKMKRLPLRIFGAAGENVNHADLVGYTCLEQDVLYQDYSGKMQEGAVVLFENVGGYSNVSKPPFILPNCPMIAINRAGEDRLLKRRETFEDIFATYCTEGKE